MSLSSATRRNDYTGNGSVSVYAYSFRIFSQDHLTVKVRSTADVETTLTLTTDYTVSGVNLGAGGNVTLVNASQSWLAAGKLKSGWTISIIREVDLVQNTDIRNQGSFYPETHEDAFDYLTMADQQQQDELDRAVKLPDTILPSVFDPTLPTTVNDNPGATIIVNSAGTAWTMSGSLTGVPNYFRQEATPTSPAADQLAFWYDTSVDQMKIWDGSSWRAFA